MLLQLQDTAPSIRYYLRILHLSLETDPYSAVPIKFYYIKIWYWSSSANFLCTK
jgi:hypothetical protein